MSFNVCGVCVCALSNSIMSDSLRPHGLQPARLLCPWDFTGKNTGVGCHFILQDLPDQGIKPTFLVSCMLNLFLFIEITGVFCVFTMLLHHFFFSPFLLSIGFLSFILLPALLDYIVTSCYIIGFLYIFTI